MPIFSRQVGSLQNPAVVFLHGFLGDSTDWDEVVAHFQGDFYCVLIDLPGHGNSTHIDSDIDNAFEKWHELINECLNKLNIVRFHLVGYSLGGRIALDYARTQYSDSLLSLTLESSHIGLVNKADKEQRAVNDQNWANKFKTQPIKQTLSQWYQQAVFSDLSALEKQTLINKKAKNNKNSVANTLTATSLSKQNDARPFLQNNNLTINYLFGEKDSKFKQLTQDFTHCKNIKIHSFCGVGHNIHAVNPLQYAQLIHKLITESK